MDTIQSAKKIMEDALELMVAKNADYGDSWRDMRITSITDQILVKTLRIKQIEESEDAPKVSEGVEAEYRDILNYCVFALIKMQDVDCGGRIYMDRVEKNILNHCVFALIKMQNADYGDLIEKKLDDLFDNAIDVVDTMWYDEDETLRDAIADMIASEMSLRKEAR